MPDIAHPRLAAEEKRRAAEKKAQQIAQEYDSQIAEVFQDALKRLPSGQPLKQICLVESSEKVYEEIRARLATFQKDDTIDDLKLELSSRTMPAEKPLVGKRAAKIDAPPPPAPRASCAIPRHHS